MAYWSRSAHEPIDKPVARAEDHRNGRDHHEVEKVMLPQPDRRARRRRWPRGLISPGYPLVDGASSALLDLLAPLEGSPAKRGEGVSPELLKTNRERNEALIRNPPP